MASVKKIELQLLLAAWFIDGCFWYTALGHPLSDSLNTLGRIRWVMGPGGGFFAPPTLVIYIVCILYNFCCCINANNIMWYIIVSAVHVSHVCSFPIFLLARIVWSFVISFQPHLLQDKERQDRQILQKNEFVIYPSPISISHFFDQAHYFANMQVIFHLPSNIIGGSFYMQLGT